LIQQRGHPRTVEPDALKADDDSSLGQQIFDIPVTEIESMVEPNGVADDIGWKPVTLVCIHHPILSIWRFNSSVPTYPHLNLRPCFQHHVCRGFSCAAHNTKPCLG
jgi:hypothetical protein